MKKFQTQLFVRVGSTYICKYEMLSTHLVKSGPKFTIEGQKYTKKYFFIRIFSKKNNHFFSITNVILF